MKYSLFRQDGSRFGGGECPDALVHLQAQPGLILITGDHGVNDTLDHASLTVIPGPPATVDYRDQRMEAYPAVAVQLDALWHAMNDGTLPMVPEFYDPIAKVKADFPNPNGITKVVL